ncbi:two-component response regulator [Nostoc commune NIES-4072]|uniref:Two-component response regulator n=1 Tax=Nostoc commune NIES-4072 TaxID=2005467 RepID=A0A2R5FWY6_NOSCO|nr:response regulator transcription factor [Nostoc commune]BBD70142.1 two-component response regulator [Nostoc commune HK-02]GBG22795.1 two-component response regulator [Nostoc commune NIES-4072]
MITKLPVSIVLVEDEPRFRAGLLTLLNFYSNNGNAEFQVVGEADSMDAALNLIAQQQPNLLLLDLELAQGDGITTLTRLKSLSYKGKVLVLSGHEEEEWIFRAMQAGAYGYVLKDRVATQLCDAIATVLNNQIYLAPEVSTVFFRLFHSYTQTTIDAAQGIHLTEREKEVLEWLVKGASNEQIASELYITVATVKAHLTAIFEKLKVNSRTQAIVKALKLGLTQ